MYDLLHAMEGSEEEEGLRAHICLIVLIKVMCCLFQEPELEASDMGCEGFEDAEILGIVLKNMILIGLASVLQV